MNGNYRIGEVREHLEDHVTYPATKDDILSTCSNMSDLPVDDRTWVAKNLPDGLYQSSGEAEKSMNI